jgi:hypothetical protein
MPVKRLHYFDHQFLVEADFTDEQAYHVGMRRRLTACSTPSASPRAWS